MVIVCYVLCLVVRGMCPCRQFYSANRMLRQSAIRPEFGRRKFDRP